MRCDPSMAFLVTSCKKRCLFLLLQLLKLEKRHLENLDCQLRGLQCFCRSCYPFLPQPDPCTCLLFSCVHLQSWFHSTLSALQEWQISELGSITQHQVEGHPSLPPSLPRSLARSLPPSSLSSPPSVGEEGVSNVLQTSCCTEGGKVHVECSCKYYFGMHTLECMSVLSVYYIIA